MANMNYSFQGYDDQHMARGLGVSYNISTKQSIEICNWIRGLNVEKAKLYLREVMEKKRAVPFKRYTDGVGHRKGKIASGRYPIKSSERFLKLLESVEANAGYKGLNTSNLVIRHASANLASRPYRHGRQSRRQMKSTHVEIVVEEGKEAPKKEAKPAKKTAPKAKETKPVEAKKVEEKPKTDTTKKPKEESKE
ncbi:50S ribosomal protein L22 [Candidatus Woesearchaeota archaeon]|jgi:large subunit ribosomal protein L22|nr:50S ribosomal protein L22 [Candidatus Woesearchaeota archaeon]MBT3537444.1 50S ribosomal protein L22 [Candidatus Woesearchaeota archaeon]MBT4697755.1 50S ribosomal protein L22 [Candidatus Woesearchaeota archaeon]MBT4717558.1 50S ribosomal protein L22 [Candidatus Woesearchaeota archaeon]MBT7106246.1 50S ribosomal protein L22 [Candidatus Woesearchaeota archaeon]